MQHSFEKIKSELSEINPDAYFFNGLENGLIGIAQQYPRHPVACYDYDKCIKSLMTQNHWNEEEATEFFEYNTVCVALGPNTPVILRQSFSA